MTVDGARRKGKTNPVKSEVDEAMGDLESLETIIVVKRTDEDAPMKDGRDHWYHELLEKADDECPPEPMDSEDPLFILYSSGSTAKPKGIVHTTAGYLTGVAYTHKLVFDLKPEEDVFWCSADVGWITGHSYIVYGPLANGTTSVMFEGAPDYPEKDVWWELIERYGVSLFYTAPTAIRAAMKWGKEYPEKHDLSSLRLLGTVGEPINPKAWLWYHTVIGGEQLPDRRHLVADRDRPHHDLAAAGASPRRSRGRRPSRCPASTPRSSRRRAATSPAPTRACWWCAGRGPGCCGRSTRTMSASSRPTGTRSARTPTRSATPPAGTRTATSGSSGARTTCSTSPATACRRPRSRARSCRTTRSPRRP